MRKDTIKGTPVQDLCQNDLWYIHIILPFPLYLLGHF
jgi:hypothetical protein